MSQLTSRAWVQRGARDMELVELAHDGELLDGDAIARVEGSGICGSDYEQYVGHFDETGIVTYPLVIGHEPVVRIEQISPAASAKWGLAVGDRVAVEPHVGCGVCEYCTSGRITLCPTKIGYGYVPLSNAPGLWGSLADYMILRGNTVVHELPEQISIEDALLFNPLGAGFEWAVKKGELSPGKDLLILGAGQRGLACVIAAKMAGAGRIVLVGLAKDARKLEIAKALGATETIVSDPADPESVTKQAGRKAFDCVVDVVPAATRPVVEAIRAAKSGGIVVLGGIKGNRPIPEFVSDEILLRAITVKGALGVASDSYKLAVAAVSSGVDFSEWHTHTFRLEQAREAIEVLGGESDDGVEPLHISVLP